VDVQVVQADGAGPGQEHHGRAPAAGAVKEQAPSPDVVELPDRRCGNGCQPVVTASVDLVLHHGWYVCEVL
jgi:hypothetical protein